MAKENGQMKISGTFRSCLTGDEIFRRFFLRCPGLAYCMYLANLDITKEGKEIITMSDCLALVLESCDMANKPTLEDMLKDDDLTLHARLNEHLSPNIILYLVDMIESTPKSRKRTVH